MTRNMAERLLSLLSITTPQIELGIRDTSGHKITSRDVAAAIAGVSDLAYHVATHKYAGCPPSPIAQLLISQYSSQVPDVNFLHRLTWMGIADATASRVCRTCNGQGVHQQTAIECLSCAGSGVRIVKERERWRHAGVSRGTWENGVRRLYASLVDDILQADGEVIEAVRERFSEAYSEALTSH